MSDQAIYEIMYLNCRGELLALVTNAITATESFGCSMAENWSNLYPRGNYLYYEMRL